MTSIYTKRLSNAYASQRQMSLSTSLQVVAVTGYQAKKTRHVVVKGLISKHLKNVMNRSENSCRKCAHQIAGVPISETCCMSVRLIGWKDRLNLFKQVV